MRQTSSFGARPIAHENCPDAQAVEASRSEPASSPVWRTRSGARGRHACPTTERTSTGETAPFPFPPIPRPAASTSAGRRPRPRAAATVGRPGADGACPATHPVKAKLSSGIFHVPGGANYDRTHADRCYVDAEAAEADGLRAVASADLSRRSEVDRDAADGSTRRGRAP